MRPPWAGFKRGTWLAGLVLAAAVVTAPAEQMAPLPPSPPPEKVLTWQDCVALAAQKNPSLVSAQYAMQASHAAYLGSFNGLMPTVTLSDSYSSVGGGITSGNGAPGYAAQAAASVSLFNMSAIAGIKSASANDAQSQAARRQASANLRYSLRSAFAQAYIADKNVEVARKILEIQKKNAEEVALKYQSGKEYKGNMLSAQALFLQARAGLAQTLRSVRTARRALDQQLGLDEFSETAVTGTLVAQPPPEFPRHIEDALAVRPDVLLQEAVIRSAQAAVTTAQSPLWPSLNANYARSRSGPYEFPDPVYGWSAGVTLSYPLFAGGPTAAYYASKSSQDIFKKSEQDLRAVRDAAVVDLETSWAAYSNAHDQLLYADANLEATRQRNSEAEIRYGAGLLTYDNWEVIVAEWVSAEQQDKQAQLTAVTAQAAWERSLGKALGE